MAVAIGTLGADSIDEPEATDLADTIRAVGAMILCLDAPETMSLKGVLEMIP